MFNWFRKEEDDEMKKYYSGSSTYWKYEEEKEQEERRQRRIHILVGCVTAAFIAFAGFVIFGATFQEESRVEVLTPEPPTPKLPTDTDVTPKKDMYESSAYQGHAEVGGGSTYEFYEIGDLTFYEETGQTNEEILSGEIEEEKASVLKHQYLILLAEKRIAACEIELFKEEHPEMSDEEKAELEKMSQEYETKKNAVKEFEKEHPEVIPLPAPTPTPPDPTPPNPAPNPGRYQSTDPGLEPPSHSAP
ncbi:hypothetical protein IJF91_00795 [Candidatus Saccharibacteria bacterium]|nr:hypothetical protein [Candidatus Saccharibacteria bacterium]